MGEVLRTLKARDTSIEQVGVTPAALGALIRLVDAGTISNTVAKGVFEQMDGTGRAAADIVAEQGLAQVSDEGVLAGRGRRASCTRTPTRCSSTAPARRRRSGTWSARR